MMHGIILDFESSIYYNRWFKDKPLVILLNKVDIFKEKLAVSPLSEYFPDFEGSNADFSAAAGYFANRFRTSATARASRDRQVCTYFTNATDTASMKATMEAISSSILV
jgi:guanine nucleotide-binding protein subunit alpha